MPSATPALAEMEARVAEFVGVDRSAWTRPIITRLHPEPLAFDPDDPGLFRPPPSPRNQYGPSETWQPPAYGSDLNLWPAIHARIADISGPADPESIEERFADAIASIICEAHRGLERGYNLGLAMMAATAEQRLRALCAVLDALELEKR